MRDAAAESFPLDELSQQRSCGREVRAAAVQASSYRRQSLVYLPPLPSFERKGGGPHTHGVPPRVQAHLPPAAQPSGRAAAGAEGHVPMQ